MARNGGHKDPSIYKENYRILVKNFNDAAPGDAKLLAAKKLCRPTQSCIILGEYKMSANIDANEILVDMDYYVKQTTTPSKNLEYHPEARAMLTGVYV